MNPEIFDAINHAALKVADYQLELTQIKQSSRELRESLHREASKASKVLSDQKMLAQWADSFFIPIESNSILLNNARKAKQDYVVYFAEHAKPSLPNDKTAETHALEVYKMSMQTANEQFRVFYLETKDLSGALAVARQTFETTFTAGLMRLLDTPFDRPISSPNNLADGIAVMSPCTPDRKALSPKSTKPVSAPTNADDSDLDDALSRLII